MSVLGLNERHARPALLQFQHRLLLVLLKVPTPLGFDPNRSYSCWLFISIPWGHAAFVGFGGRRQGPDERASLSKPPGGLGALGGQGGTRRSWNRLAQDLAAMRVRGILRQEIWTILREIGLVSEPEHHRHDPGPKRDQTRHLRLVEK